MFPPCCLLCIFLCLLLGLPLGKLPLPLLALKKCLNLWEQDTGQGLHFVAGIPVP